MAAACREVFYSDFNDNSTACFTKKPAANKLVKSQLYTIENDIVTLCTLLTKSPNGILAEEKIHVCPS